MRKTESPAFYTYLQQFDIVDYTQKVPVFILNFRRMIPWQKPNTPKAKMGILKPVCGTEHMTMLEEKNMLLSGQRKTEVRYR